jgi:AmmeMemoRadiSam system protein A
MSDAVSEEVEIQNESAVHKKLLPVARECVAATIRHKPIPEFKVTEQELFHHHGVFVTIRRHGQLRGCIGRFVSDIPLYRLVKEMAVAAATKDARFKDERLKESELSGIDIEVSILSSLQRISNPLDFQLGRHGIYIKKGEHVGCLLPQVAEERGWSKEEFLSNCCTGKAGLGPGAWKEPGTEVYVFVAGVVSESA